MTLEAGCRRPSRAASLLAVLFLLTPPAQAATLTIGPGGPASLAEAVARATPGDTVHLPPGEFYECTVLSQPGLTVEGEGDSTVLTDRTCEGKAILVIRGDRTVVRNLVLARARVPDGNGAGIRLEAQDLVLDHVRFRNDEVGLLAGQPGPGTVLIRDCAFEAGGVPTPRATAAVMVAAVALLQVERTTFTGVKGNQLSTEADRTELTGNTIETGTDPGAGHAVVANGGLLRMDGNTLSLGANPPPRGAAVLALSGATVLRGNRLLNASGAPAVLLLDWTHDTPVLSGNQVPPGDEESSTAGLWRHRASGAAHATYDGARHLAGGAKRAIGRLFGG